MPPRAVCGITMEAFVRYARLAPRSHKSTNHLTRSFAIRTRAASTMAVLQVKGVSTQSLLGNRYAIIAINTNGMATSKLCTTDTKKYSQYQVSADFFEARTIASCVHKQD